MDRNRSNLAPGKLSSTATAKMNSTPASTVPHNAPVSSAGPMAAMATAANAHLDLIATPTATVIACPAATARNVVPMAAAVNVGRAPAASSATSLAAASVYLSVTTRNVVATAAAVAAANAPLAMIARRVYASRAASLSA